MLSLLVLVLAVGMGLAEGQVRVERHNDTNNAFALIPNPGESTPYVRFLGVVDTTDECIARCVNLPAPDRCHSYIYHTAAFEGGYASHCYGRVGEVYGVVWTPMKQALINSGRVFHPCSTDADCSFNGACEKGTCRCDPQWRGGRCDELVLRQATRGAGYNLSDDGGAPTSSWGGGVLVDHTDPNPDTRYHMYLAEFQKHCGVNSWTLNSVVTHAQSTKGWNGPYRRVEVLHKNFAHEPNACRGPQGEYVVYYATYNYPNYTECVCSDGSTPPTCTLPASLYTEVMQHAPSPNGPWSPPTVIFPHRTLPLKPDDDTNLAGVIEPSGEFVGLFRIWGGNGSTVHRVGSPDWKNGAAYDWDREVLFPQLGGGGTEDPFVYKDCRGRYHALFHNKYPDNAAEVVGGHAYSSDGKVWVYSGSCYGSTVSFDDGTTTSFSRRERPHFVFADDGCTPIALTTGVQYGGKYGDATLTLLQPVGPASDAH